MEKQILEDLLAQFRANPEGYEINKKIGLYMTRVRKYQIHAEPHLRKALSHNIKDSDTKNLLDSLAVVCGLKGKREDSVKVCELARRICPESPIFDFRLGHTLFSVGRFEESSNIFRDALNACYARARQTAENGDRPLVHILEQHDVICRFFGEMAAKPDLYLKARRMGWFDAAEPVLLAPPEMVCNPALLDYWRNHIVVVGDKNDINEYRKTHKNSWVFLDYITLPDGRTLHRDLAHRAVQNQWQAEGRGPLLELKEADRTRGWEKLKAAGVAEDDAWIVTLHVREAGSHDEDTPWSLNRHRNADISTYLPAIEEITSRGGWVVRLGDPSMTPLPEMERLIDYAHAGEMRADWMDIFLIAESRFYLGMATGPSSVAVNFGVPTVGTNWFHLGPWPYCKDDIFIHKLLRDKESGRTLSIAESLAPPLFGALEPLFFEARKLEPVDNTAEEILEATREMLDRLQGKPAYTEEDERRQDAYRRQADPFGIPITSRLARDFLRRHPELIEAGG